MKYLIIVSVLTQTLLGEIVTLWREDKPSFLRKGVAVISESFDFVNISSICRDVLEEDTNRHVLIHLRIYPTRDSARPLPKIDHMDYSYWKHYYAESKKLQGPAAEMTSIRGNAVLKFRDSDGLVTETVLKGKNPLTFEIGGSKVRVIPVVLSDPSPLDQRHRVDIYVHSKPLISIDSALSIVEDWKTLFPGFDITLVVREDPWFVWESTFPFYYSFSESADPPMLDSYTGLTLRCNYAKGSQACRIQGPRP